MSLIFCWPSTLPSVPRNRIHSAPRDGPPSLSPLAPTASSACPSPFRSPTPASAVPNASLSSRPPVKPPVDWPISTKRSTVPPVASVITYTAPRFAPRPSSPGAPTAISIDPSPPRSPSAAIEEPKRSWSASSASKNPSVSLIFRQANAEPSSSRNTIQIAPRFVPPSSSLGAPTARSTMPSELRSPMAAMAEPNRAPSERNPPKLPWVELIFSSDRTSPGKPWAAASVAQHERARAEAKRLERDVFMEPRGEASDGGGAEDILFLRRPLDQPRDRSTFLTKRAGAERSAASREPALMRTRSFAPPLAQVALERSARTASCSPVGWAGHPERRPSRPGCRDRARSSSPADRRTPAGASCGPP